MPETKKKLPESFTMRRMLMVLLPVILIPTLGVTGWMVRAWGDERYVQQEQLAEAQSHRDLENIDDTIDAIDDRLFELEQDLLFEEPASIESRKLNAKKAHYESRKEDEIRERDVVLKAIAK